MFGVDLPAYHGPIDLLLYLIRREELPLEEISLAKITSRALNSPVFWKMTSSASGSLTFPNAAA